MHRHHFHACLTAAFLLTLGISRITPEENQSPCAEASLELGSDNLQRRIFRPYLTFRFPISTASLFVEMDWTQRLDRDLQGPIDFRLSTGLIRRMNGALALEFRLRHFCRHLTSRNNPDSLDVNELFVRLWGGPDSARIGIGAGGYLGPSDGHRTLLLAGFHFPRLQGSELSVDSEIIWVDLKRILYRAELSAALNTNLDLFVRWSKTYADPSRTDLGLRARSSGGRGRTLDRLSFGAVLHPEPGDHKVRAENGFRLLILNRERIRLLLALAGRVPVRSSENFFGPFQPDVIRYPIGLEYEKRIGNTWRLFGFCKYQLIMPVDENQDYTSELGIGLGLRNRPDFERLEGPVRVDFRAGRTFGRAFIGRLRLGLNTGGGPLRLALDLDASMDDRLRAACITAFVETTGTIAIRPFLALEQESLIHENHSRIRPAVGIRLLHWFRYAD